MNDQKTYEMPVYRLQLVRESTITAKPLRDPGNVIEFVQDIAVSDRENMVAVFLNTKHHPIGRHTISIGTLNGTSCDPHSLLKAALLANAFGIVLCHNHPSGVSDPSSDDDKITAAIALACLLLNICLVDHVIVTPHGNYYSYREQNPQLLEGDSL